MTAALTSAPAAPTTMDETKVVALSRRTVDKVLIGFGVVAAVVFAVAGGLLTWGSELRRATTSTTSWPRRTSSSPTPPRSRRRAARTWSATPASRSPPATEAEAYAGYIDGHLEGIADGKTYSRSTTGAQAAAVDGAKAGASEAEIAELQATADELKAQRDTLFKGETLRACCCRARLVDGRAGSPMHRRVAGSSPPPR